MRAAILVASLSRSLAFIASSSAIAFLLGPLRRVGGPPGRKQKGTKWRTRRTRGWRAAGTRRAPGESTDSLTMQVEEVVRAASPEGCADRMPAVMALGELRPCRWACFSSGYPSLIFGPSSLVPPGVGDRGPSVFGARGAKLSAAEPRDPGFNPHPDPFRSE